MVYSINTSASAALLGVGSHLLFRNYEPSALAYLALNGLIFWGSAGTSVVSGGLTVLPALVKAVQVFLSFNLALSSSIVAYRLSPWHPLAAYPGPILARASKLWMLYWTTTGKRHLVITRLHQKYGVWVRTGPNELSINSPDAIRPIYSKLFRGPTHYKAAPQDADALITITDRAEHDRRLVGWTKAFSTDALHRYRLNARTRTDQLIELLREKSASGPFDLWYWVHLWTLDNMGDMAFSGGFEKMRDGGDTEGWLDILHMGIVFIAIIGNIPWIGRFLEVAPQPDPIKNFQKFAARKVEETKARGASARNDIMSIIQSESDITPAEAQADATFVILAGSDTVSEGLAGTFRLVAGDQRVQEELRAEVQAALKEHGELDDTTLSRLPYLDACVQESLRLIPPVPIGPPRYSHGQGYEIEGHYIPPQTTVGCPNYTMTHDAKNFSDPEEFKPERWLPGFKGVHNMDAYVPFCYGPGVCVGKPVALFNMKLILAKVVTNFRISIPKDVDIKKYDDSWKEFGIWKHDSLLVDVVPL